MPPAPKPKEQRVSRVKPVRGEWVDLEWIQEPVLEPLPDLDADGMEWTARARASWEAWRMDPVTVMWSPADVDYALGILMLDPVRDAGEVRQRMIHLGFTPAGRRALRYRLPCDPDQSSGLAPKQQERPADRASRGARKLRAVDPS